MAPVIHAGMGRLARRVVVSTALSAAWVVTSAGALAQTDAVAEVSQQQVEAAYLYKFGGYVTWPDKAFANADSPIVIGVAGADRLADDLKSVVSGRSIGNRPVVVRRLGADDALTGVHILFIGGASTAQASGLIESSRGQPILVVTEGANGLSAGGAISLIVVDNRVRFDVSLDAAQQNGLKLSALLLSVAHSVKGAKP